MLVSVCCVDWRWQYSCWLLVGRLTVCVRWRRLRVKDINDAIKELGQMIASHTGSGQPMTRLMIVQEAVTVITALEQQLRGILRPPRWWWGLSHALHGQEQEQVGYRPHEAASASVWLLAECWGGWMIRMASVRMSRFTAVSDPVWIAYAWNKFAWKTDYACNEFYVGHAACVENITGSIQTIVFKSHFQ